MTINSRPFEFGTKSETLLRLQPLLSQSKILPIFSFSEDEWNTNREAVLRKITTTFSNGELIIRSSAKNEDGGLSSMAGAFLSCMNVPITQQEKLIEAIAQVIASFSHFSHRENQILIQPMLSDINMSGVVMTYDLEHGAPYYVINYDDESGLTDTITGGIGIQKTVLIYRNIQHEKVKSSRIKKLLIACKELELLCDNVPLDIEFAIDNTGVVYIFQVRRITLSNSWHPVTERRVARKLNHVFEFIKQINLPKSDIFGDNTILGVMPDWNPAEIIGTTPRPLASSLYRHVITQSVWRESRAAMGYFNPAAEELMVMIDHHPYIDVRNSFNSFLPNNISNVIKNKLVNAWLQRLNEHTQWHDKVEFNIVQTCVDFNFEQDFSHRYNDVLTAAEKLEYHRALHTLTANALTQSEDGTLQQALNVIKSLEKEQNTRVLEKETAQLSQVAELLNSCKNKGTYAFSIIARHAFIAESLLRSAVQRGALTQERLQAFKQSIHTITTDLAKEYKAVCSGCLSSDTFLKKYGHLRPGTYDITSFRYDERSDLFTYAVQNKALDIEHQFLISPDEHKQLDFLLKESGLQLDVDALLDYIKSAIAGREYAKFIFTRDLSDALVGLSCWGAKVGLSRDDLSYLDINTLLNSLTEPLLDDIDRVLLGYVEKNKSEYEQAKTLKLGHLISKPEDVFVIPLHRSMANYITGKIVDSDLVVLSTDTPATTNFTNKIVAIVNADPGYDWLFTKGISGLITQYGGTNSHMAIRCAEFGIPAAIGCGEQLFARIIKSRSLVLNCRDKKVELF